MRSTRFWRLALACRLPFLVVTLVLIIASSAAADTVRGLVVDESGRPVPRAYVRVLDGASSTSGVYANDAGLFEIVAPGTSTCRVEVTLTGFRTATIPCIAPSSEPLRVVLTIAPIRETVIVSATRTDTPASQVGASASVFTEADLERRQMPLIADLLRLTPGVMVTRNGGAGSLTSVFVRGGESDYNKVLLDGVPLNEPGGNFYFSNLTTENLERVEILRGAYSSLFGSDAMASVVQLFTKRGDRNTRRPRASAQIDGGSYNTMHLSTAVSGATEQVDYSVSASQFNTDNRVENNRFENTTLTANAGVALGPTATLRLIARGELEHVGTPGVTAFGRPDLDAFFERRDTVAAVSVDHQSTASIRERASYSLAVSNQQSTNLIADPSFTATFPGQTASFESSDFIFDNQNNFNRHHASYQADWHVLSDAARGDHLLTALVDWDGERATLENRLGASQTRASRNNFGVALQDQVLWRRLFVTVGARIEHNASFGTHTVPRGSALYVARQSQSVLGDTRIRASVGTGIKEPSLLESFGTSFFSKGNPDLEPERSRSAEVGVEQRFAGDRARVDVAYFDNRFRDLIWTETTDFATFAGQYFNLVGLSRARGLEFTIDVAPIAAVQASAGYSLVDSEILESNASTVVFQEGNWAFRRPRHSGYVRTQVVWRQLSADLSGVFVGRFVDNDFGLFTPGILEVPARTTWDARIAVNLRGGVTALLTVDNLTNRDYMEPIGYQALQRVVRAGLRVRF